MPFEYLGRQLAVLQNVQHHQEIFNKISLQEFSYTLQEVFVILYTGMPYNFLIVCKFLKHFASRDCFAQNLKFITAHHLKSTCAGICIIFGFRKRKYIF